MQRFLSCVCALALLTTAATAQQWLKQSTDATLVIGPFVDSLDGASPEGSLTISQGDIRLSKNGGTFAQTNNSAGATVMENGYYSVPLNTTDTNTLGRLRVAVNESGALPVWQDFMVVPANVHDSLVGQHATDKLEIDVSQVAGQSATVASTPIDANVTKWIGTTIPGVDTAGYPKVTIKDGTGAGEIDTASGALANVLEKAQLAQRALVAATDTGTHFEISAGETGTNAYKDYVLRIIDASSSSCQRMPLLGVW